MTIIGLLIMVFYFRKARTSDQSPGAIVVSLPRKPIPAVTDSEKNISEKPQPVDVLRDDTVPSAIVMSPPRKPIPVVADSVKSNSEKPQPTPQNDNSADIQSEEKPEQTNQTPISQKKPVGQLLIKLTTDESCKLKITNIDLDEVIDWDLSPNDNGTIYLKPGKYSIVATSEISSSKTKAYYFNVKPGQANTRQNIRIRF
jgi:hypothetical protein